MKHAKGKLLIRLRLFVESNHSDVADMKLYLVSVIIEILCVLGSDSASWTTHVGLDCYEGKGGDPILPDPFSSSMSPTECRAVCLEDVACEGVVTSSGQDTGYCYKRRNLKLKNCVRDSKWTLHNKKGGKKSLVEVSFLPRCQHTFFLRFKLIFMEDSCWLGLL